MEVLASPEQVAPRPHRLPHDENMLANFEEEEEKVLSTRPSASNDDTHRGVLEAVEETLNSTNPFVGNGEASDLSAATPTAAAQDAENSPNNTSSTSGVVAKAQDRQRGRTDRTAITASSASSSYTASSSVTSSSSARSASSSSTASASSVSKSSASDDAHPQHHHNEIKKKPSVHTSHAGEGQHNGVNQPDRAQEAEKSNSNSANAQNTPEHTAAATVVSVNITATTPDAGPHPVTVVRLAPHVLAPSQDFAEGHNTRTLLAHHHTSPKRLQGQPILAPIAAAPDAPSLPSLIAAGPLPSQRVPQPTAQRSLVRTDDDTKRMTQETLKDRNVDDAPTAEQVTRQQTRSSSSDSEVSRRAAGAMALKTQSDLASTLAQIRRNLTEGLDTSEEDYRDETENDDEDGEGHNDDEKEDEDAMPVPRRDVPQRVQYHARRSASASSSSAASARSDGTAERHQAQPKRHDDEVVHHHRPHSDHPSIATDDGEEEQYDNDDDDDYYYEDMDDAEEDEEEEDEEEPHIDIIEGTGHGALMTEILYGTPSASAVVPVATRRETKHRDDAFLHSVQEDKEEERYEEKEIGERKATAPESGESDSEEDNTTAPHRRRTRTPERVARPLLQSTAGHYEDYEASYHEATEMANKEGNKEEDAEKAVYAHGEPFTEAVPRPIQSSAPSDFDEDDDEEEDVEVIDAGEVRHAHRSAGVRPLGRRETRHRASGHPSQVHKAHRTNDNIHHHYHRRVAPPAAPPTPHDVAYRAESEEKEESVGRGVVPPQPKKKEEEEGVLDLMQGGSAYSADDERAPPSPPHNGQLQLPPAEATHEGNATPSMNVMVVMLRESSTTQPAANVSAALLPSSQAEMTIPPISDAVAGEGNANTQTAIPLPNAPETSTPAVATTEPVTVAEGVKEASHATTAPAAVVNEVQTSTAPVTEAAAVEAAPAATLPPHPQAETNAPTTVTKASGAPTTAEPKKRGVWARLRHYFTGKDKPSQKKGASHPTNNNNTAGAPKEAKPKTKKKKKSMSSPLNLCKKDTTVAKKNQPSATTKSAVTPPTAAEAPAKAQEPTTTPPKADEAPASTTPVPLPEPSHPAEAVEEKKEEKEVSAAAPEAETVKEAAAPPQTTTTTTTAANTAGAPLVTVAVTVQQPTQQAQASLQLTPVSSALHPTTPPVSHISPSSPPLLLQDAAAPGAAGQSAQEDLMKKKKNRSEAETESSSTSSAGAKYRHHHSRPRRRGQRRGQRRYRARSPVDDVDEQSQDARRSEDDDGMDDDAAYRHGVRTPQKEDIDVTPFRKHRVHRQHRRRVSSRPHGLVASHDKMRALE